MKTNYSRSLTAWGVTSVLLGMSHTTFAADAPGATQELALEEIVVTATRRETSAQETPLSISAISGGSLRDEGIVDPRQLSSLAPNLQIDQGTSNGQTHVTLRGIANTDFGIAANSPVATYIDDIYQPFQFGLATQIYDMNRIEVLRGPQGTLFGKNATSGALNYFSQTPTDKQEGYVMLDAGGGDFNHYAVEGAYNQPITDILAMRASMRVTRRDDYVKNLFDGGKLGHYNNYNARVQFALNPSDATKINLKLFGIKQQGDGPIYTAQYLPNATYGNACNSAFGPPQPGVRPGFPAQYFCATGTPAPDSPNSRTTYSEVPIYENFYNYGAVLKLDQKFGEYILTAIAGYQKGFYELGTNDDGVAGDAFHSFQGSRTSQSSLEVRLATPKEDTVNAVIGTFFQIDKTTTDQGSSSTELDTGTTPFVDNFGYDYYAGALGRQKDTSMAAFSSVTYNVTQMLSLTGGARYSREKKDVTVDFLSLTGNRSPTTGLNLLVDDISYERVLARYGSIILPTDVAIHPTDAHTWSKFTWDFNANFKPTDDALIFARIASGFRSGGYQVGITGATNWNYEKPYVDPETVLSYELGAKTEWLDHTLRVNGSVFWMNYNNMQVQIINTGGIGSKLKNAAKSRIKGAELEVAYAPIKALLLEGAVGYTDAKFLDFDNDFENNPDPNRVNRGDARGDQLPYAPKWTGSVGAKYEIPQGSLYSWRLGTNWTYRSKVYFDVFEEEVASDKSRTIGNVDVGFGTADKGWRVTAYVNNVTDEDQKAFAFAFGGAGNAANTYAPNSFLIAPSIHAPKRTWGLRASYDF